MRGILILIISIFFYCSSKAQSSHIDSLKLILEEYKGNSIEKVKILNELAEIYRNNNPKQALSYLEKAIPEAQQVKAWKELAQIYRQIGNLHRLQGNHDRALTAYLNSLKVSEDNQLEIDAAKALNGIGLIHRNQKNYVKALDYHRQSIKVAKRLSDNELIANNLNNIGLVNKAQNKLAEALQSTYEALAIYKLIKHSEGIVNAQNNIGKTFEKMGQADSAIYYFEQTIALAEQTKNINLVSELLTNIASIYAMQTDKQNLALKNLNKALEYAQQMNNNSRIASIYEVYSHLYEKQGNTSKAFEYYKKTVKTKEALYSEEKMKQIEQIQAGYESEKKDQELALKNSEIKRQMFIRNALLVAFVLFLVLSTWLLRNNRQKQKLNKELQFSQREIKTKNEELRASEEELRQNMEELETNQEELRAQKEQLEVAFYELHKQNTKVNDSIRYAERIQNAILPHENILASAFAEHFVIFKPKDVVSGDFYWYVETTSIINEQLPITNEQLPINTEKQNKEQPNYSTIQLSNYSKKKFLAVVDCTGHGVPGAFMSMIGNTLLSEIITTKHIHEPHLVLEQLHLGILNSLNKKDNQMQDGMDIALCCIETLDNEQVKVQFSGAKRPLYYFSNQSLSQLSADKKSIGQAKADGKYSLQEISLKKGDTLYMTTDGWIDTINPERHRFGSQRFKEMLLKAAHLPLHAQKEVFASILEDYEQGTERRDDVLMVGVKI
jgi:serine phosphatase RsbU (regulator of sigma subunit)